MSYTPQIWSGFIFCYVVKILKFLLLHFRWFRFNKICVGVLRPYLETPLSGSKRPHMWNRVITLGESKQYPLLNLFSSLGFEPKLSQAWLGFGSSFWEKKLSSARLFMPSKELGLARLAISCKKSSVKLGLLYHLKN